MKKRELLITPITGHTTSRAVWRLMKDVSSSPKLDPHCPEGLDKASLSSFRCA